MVRLVHRRIAARGIGREAVLAEAAAHVVLAGRVAGAEGHVDAPAQIAEHRAAIALDARYHLDLPGMMQLPAFVARAQHAGQVVHAARREREPVRRRGQPRGIRDRRHLDRALGAVEERVEHPRVEIAGGHHLRREAVVGPHGVRGRRVVLGQVLRALAGGDHLEPRGAAPVDHLADQRRLVAVGERVDDAGLPRAPREQRARERVGFDVDHHDVLAVRAAGEHVTDARRRMAGRVDDDLDLRRGNERERVVGDEGGAGLRGGGERSRPHSVAAPSRCARAMPWRDPAQDRRSPTTWMPGVCFACARYIAPNLPAPIRPTLSGRPSAARASSMRWRFTA